MRRTNHGREVCHQAVVGLIQLAAVAGHCQKPAANYQPKRYQQLGLVLGPESSTLMPIPSNNAVPVSAGEPSETKRLYRMHPPRRLIPPRSRARRLGQARLFPSKKIRRRSLPVELIDEPATSRIAADQGEGE